MIENLAKLISEARTCADAVTDEPLWTEARARFLGKTGSITALMKQLGKLRGEERAHQGQILNQLKGEVDGIFHVRLEAIRNEQLIARLDRERVDVTLPGRRRGTGGVHPITASMERIELIFRSIGFEVADGPEIELDSLNFTALNMPSDHPARSMHDTFYVDRPNNQGSAPAQGDLVLRTHTSPMQIRHARQKSPPIKVIAPGKTYRVDSDATHSPMFHQFEGLWIDKNVSFADLKSVYIDFIQQFFDRKDISVRFRPSYFPFTEPSAEIDIKFPDGPLADRWLEVSGSGQVHPNVVRNIGLDPEEFIGFAFGSGVERLAMLRYGVDDLRLFFDNDLRFLQQFA